MIKINTISMLMNRTVLLTFILACTLTACTTKKTEQPKPASSPAATQTPATEAPVTGTAVGTTTPAVAESAPGGDIPSVTKVSASTPKGMAADFSWTGSDGKEHSLADYRGKVVVLNFWATWCPPCREELPALVKVRNELSPEGVEVLGLSVDREEDGKPVAEMLAKFSKENHLSYPVIIANPELSQAYGGIEGIPATFIVDKEGRIAEQYVGSQEESVFRAGIAKAMK